MISCEVCDNGEKVKGAKITYVYRDKTGTPQWYRCDAHMTDDDLEDYGGDYKGWEKI